MKIGLMGFEFKSANKGCEALTYSFLTLLSQLNLGEEITIYNYFGTELGILTKYFPNFSFVNVMPKLKDLSFKYIRSILNCDIIFDVTMGDSFSDIYSEDYYNNLIRHKRIAESLCKKYILLPQTYGPFKSDKAANKAKRIFSRAYKIYCRDELSKKLLDEKFGIKNSELTSDMAFVLPYKKELYYFDSINKVKLGINVSGLLYKGGFNSENQFNLALDYKSYIQYLIEYLSKKEEYEVHLVPHVIDLREDSYDDDYKTCKKLQQKYSGCILAPAFNTPIEAKSYIANLDVFIGSRMHSTIASFSSGVATIPVSYSRKFEGLFNSLDYEYVINGREENTQSAFNKTVEYVKNYIELRYKQNNSLKIIENKNKLFMSSLSEVICATQKKM